MSFISDPVFETQSCRHWGLCGKLYAQVSMAGRSMNRLWHKMAATAVGSCMCTEAAEVQLASVCRYQRIQAEELLSPGVTAQPRLNILQSFLLFSFPSLLLLWKLSLLLPIHLLISPISPAQSPSPSLFSGESAVPRRPACASAEMTSILSAGGFIVLLLAISTTCPCTRSCVPTHIKE